MIKKIDAIGLVCPMPVVKAKKALSESDIDILEILVDNEIAVSNLGKLADSMKIEHKNEKIKENKYKVTFIKNDINIVDEKKENDTISYAVVVISSKVMGSGDDGLGYMLIKGFIYSLTQLDVLPKAVLFYNSGAFLTTKGSECIEDLKVLESLGVEILTCGACLTHYDLKDDLLVGDVTNMYVITELQMNASKIIKP